MLYPLQKLSRGVHARGDRSIGFWLIVLAATTSFSVFSASAPLLIQGTTDVLHSSSTTAGFLVSVTGLSAIAFMILAGIAASRWGSKTVALISAVIASLGLVVMMTWFTIPGIIVARILYGAGNSGITVATTAWVSSTSPLERRGRALGYFGISVWVGQGLGPALGENVYAQWGNIPTWMVLLVMQIAVFLLLLVIAAPTRTAEAAPPKQRDASPHPRNTGLLWGTIPVPAFVSLAAWGAQGFISTFLIAHLESQGLDSTGIFGAASVFTVFAASVVGARIVFGGLSDKAGPVRTIQASLIVIAIGLAIVAYAPSFLVATLGAVAMGIGYAPLYPALTILSTNGLPPALQPTAIGLFSASTSLGMALGALGGGALIVATSSSATLVFLAGAQLLAVLIVSAAQLRRARRNPIQTE